MVRNVGQLKRLYTRDTWRSYMDAPRANGALRKWSEGVELDPMYAYKNTRRLL